MVAAEMTNGVASGWSVYPGFLTSWDWNAYGSLGSAHGTARSREDAITAAQAERERLRG